MRGHYIDTDHGQVRVWLTTESPATLVLPGVRWSGRPLAEEIAGTSPARGVAVADLPGVAGSAPGAAAAVDTAAQALAQAATALGTRAVVGLDASCDLAAAVAARVPGEPDLLLVDPGFLVELRETPMPDLSPRPDGTHLVALWNLVRDAHLFAPRSPRRAVPGRAELPGPHALDRTVVAFSERPEAFAALWRTWCRAADDPLGAHAREAADVVNADGTGPTAMTTWLDGLPDAPAGAGRPHSVPRSGTGVRREYVETPQGQIHLRVAGDPEAPTLLAFHSAPGSANLLETLLRGLAPHFQVIAPDYPGNGESAKPWTEDVDIARLADAMAEVVRTRVKGPVHLWGTHTGAVIAMELAIRHPALVNRVIMEAPPLLPADFTAEVLENYLPPLRPDRFGGHLVQAWGMRRDMFLFWPWYRERVAATRPLRVPRPAELHDWTVGLLQSGTTYHLSYAAAFRYPTAERLPELRAPGLICAGPDDMLADNMPALRAVAPPNVTVTPVPATCWYPDQDSAAVARTVRCYRDFLTASES